MGRARRRWLVILLTMPGASTPAWASYRDGFFGLVVLFFAVPAAIGLFLLAGMLREAALFEHALWRRAFFAGVASAWLGVLLWSLTLGDASSAALIGVGGGMLLALATGPAWWRRPSSASESVRWWGRRWLAAYWIGSGLWPVAQTGSSLLRAELPADALLWALVLPALIFGGPRWVGAVALLQRRRSADAWLALALLVAALGVARSFAMDAPAGVSVIATGLLAVDLLVWSVGRRRLARHPG